jgi:hypothetical protein
MGTLMTGIYISGIHRRYELVVVLSFFVQREVFRTFSLALSTESPSFAHRLLPLL